MSRFYSYCLLIVLLVTLVGPASARMYQWIDPVTGSGQMYGKPPAWCRSDWNGPRIRVFDNGTIVDDISILVFDDEMQALRQEAFRQFDESQRLNALKRLESEALREAERQDRLSKVDELPVAALGDEEVDEALSDNLTEETIDQFKDLINEWDSLNIPLDGQ